MFQLLSGLSGLFGLFSRGLVGLADLAATATAGVVATVDPSATAEAVEGAADGGILGMIINFSPFILIAVVFYFLMIRPQRKKDKQVKDMLSNVKVGDRITTIGGIHGTVTSIKDDIYTVAVGQDKTKLVFAKWAIRNVDEVSISNDQDSLT